MRLIRSEKKFVGLIAGTGSGKTYLLPRFLYCRMNQFPGHEWIVSAPTIPMLKRNPWKYCLDFLQLERIPHEKNESDLVLKMKLGRVHFISAETPERMQGIHCKGVLGDEAGLYSRLWFDTAVQRVSFHRGQVALFTTPYSMNWVKTDFFDEAIRGNPDFHVENPASIDNPFYPQEEYERAKRILPDWKFKMMFLGQFTKPAGLIFPDFQVVEDFDVPTEWTRIRGLDFGHNHPTALVTLARDPAGTWFIIREFKRSGMDLDQIDEVVRDGGEIITYGDHAQRVDLQTLKNRGRNVRTSNKSVLSGILFVNSLFKTGRLRIFRSCRQIMDELNAYQWKMDKTENLTEDPVKVNDDLLDALRYALFTYSDTAAIDFSPVAVDWI